jgi:hypothetical protein
MLQALLILVLIVPAFWQDCGTSVSTGERVFMPVYSLHDLAETSEWQALEERREAERSPVIEPLGTVLPAGSEPDPPAPPASTVPSRIAWRPEVERWRGLVDRYFTGQGESEHALAIIRCESVGDPNAVNPSSGTAGLFQHRPQYWAARSAAAGWAGASILDPEANIAVAAWLVHKDGWQHWSGRAWGVDSCAEWACAQGVCDG